MVTSLPSSPEPSNRTRVALPARGVPIRGMLPILLLSRSDIHPDALLPGADLTLTQDLTASLVAGRPPLGNLPATAVATGADVIVIQAEYIDAGRLDRGLGAHQSSWGCRSRLKRWALCT